MSSRHDPYEMRSTKDSLPSLTYSSSAVSSYTRTTPSQRSRSSRGREDSPPLLPAHRPSSRFVSPYTSTASSSDYYPPSSSSSDCGFSMQYSTHLGQPSSLSSSDCGFSMQYSTHLGQPSSLSSNNKKHLQPPSIHNSGGAKYDTDSSSKNFDARYHPGSEYLGGGNGKKVGHSEPRDREKRRGAEKERGRERERGGKPKKKGAVVVRVNQGG